MADLKKVTSGEPLKIPASTYNLFIDTARDFQKRQNKVNGGDSGTPLQSKFVLVKNTTANAVVRFGVLGISNSELSVNENYFKQNIVLSGVAPSSASHCDGRFVICHEPIAAGGVGRAVINGHYQAQINVTDAGHTFCDVKDNDTTMLQSAESGPAVIIWKEAGTGTKWAIIRFGGSGGGGSVEIEWARVIVCPKYADPASFDLSGGIGYYTLRLVSAGDLPVYASGTSYQDGTQVVYPDQNGNLYQAKNGTGTPPVQSGHQPDISPTYWTKLDEIKVEHALGADGKDIRLFTPWYEAGAVVPIISRSVVGVGTRYYIWTAQTYGGAHDQASIRWNETDKRAMACYK